MASELYCVGTAAGPRWDEGAILASDAINIAIVSVLPVSERLSWAEYSINTSISGLLE